MPHFLKKTLIIAGIFSAAFLFLSKNHLLLRPDPEIAVKKEILAGSTFSVLAAESGIATSTRSAILASAREVHDLAGITAGKELKFIYDKKSGILKELSYEIDKENELVVRNVSTTTALESWEAKKIPIEYGVKIAQASGVITSSLYETIVSENLDQRLALALAETFAWQIDFAAQIQKGDSFKVIYEKKYRGGQYDHPGNILAAEFINNGEKFLGFYFEGEKTKEGLPAEVLTKAGYYDESGNSLQKVFLKAPLQYKYISSGFTYARLNPITGRTTPHRGIDYAAPRGTPAVTVGDGTITQAGWNGEYGISIKVRHNETYTTVYGHFASLAKNIRAGARVKQGQIIGYVGSTGLSTGPHLHYEMHKFGSFINPFTEKIPAGEPIKEADRADFEAVKNNYQVELGKI